MRRLASVIDSAGPPGEPLRVLHLGGGALALPRYVAATRPGSRQRVVDRDAALITLVRRGLPVPPPAGLPGPGAAARTPARSTPPPAVDPILGGVFPGARTPGAV